MSYLMITTLNQTLNLWKQTRIIDLIVFLASVIILNNDFPWWRWVWLRRVAECPVNNLMHDYDYIAGV